MTQWAWQHQNWPDFYWNEQQVSPHLASARLIQGKLLGIVQGINQQAEQTIQSLLLTEEALETSAIEGQILSRDSVYSSISNRLGLERAGMNKPPDRYIEGLLDLLLDATQHHQTALTSGRLHSWQAGLFPTGYSGIRKIAVGKWRENDVQIVSGQPGKTRVHYQGPPAHLIENEIDIFLNWFNKPPKIDGLLRAAIAHLWFELLHPFEDGNGRIGRAIIDLSLAQDEQQSQRYYSLSSAIMQEKKQYYTYLEKSCCGNLDISDWLIWFLGCFKHAIENTMNLLQGIQLKNQFWLNHTDTPLNNRQKKVLNRLLDTGKKGFIGGMTTRKYQQLTKTSRATAYRELSDLVKKKCLTPITKTGRSAAYEIYWH